MFILKNLLEKILNILKKNTFDCQKENLNIQKKLKERNEKFDFLFIDAAKSHYKEFLDEALPLLEAGSVIIADNTIFRGRVASDDFDPSGKYKTNIKKLREFNKYVMEDPRFESTVQAIGDGLTIIKLL